MAIDSEAKRWAIHAFASTPAVRNTVFNPDTSGLNAIERATVLRYGGTISWDAAAAIVGGGNQIYMYEWMWDKYL